MVRMKMDSATKEGIRMAEFLEVMRQGKRMCKRFKACDHCPIYNAKLACPVIDVTDDKYDVVERIIMDWAAEHPEPRYPTWNEWYQECLPDAPLKCRRAFMYTSCGTRACDACLSEPIPADIAQKLGIKPITEKE